ncbi:hypothetical protein KAH37_09400 [bacterium]|nr:hypothetical protein [bacterium]
MKKVLLLVVLFLMVFGCGSVEQTEIKSAVKSEYITVVDDQFRFLPKGNVYIYTKADSEDELEMAKMIAAAVGKAGFHAIIDTGQSMDYENESFRVFIEKKMLSVMYFASILHPNGPKSNEARIANVKAETLQKTADALVEFVKSRTKSPQQ